MGELILLSPQIVRLDETYIAHGLIPGPVSIILELPHSLVVVENKNETSCPDGRAVSVG